MIYFVSNSPDLLSTDLPYQTASVLDVINYFKDKDIIEVDTETSSLNFISGRILLLQLGDPEHQFVIHPEVGLLPFRDLLEDRSKLKILHNVKFDYKFLKRAGITLENVYDIMLVEQVLNTGKESVSVSLASIAMRYLGVEIDKTLQKSFLTAKFINPSQIVYAATDVMHLSKIRELQLPKLKESKLELVASLENKAVLAFADIEYNGIGIDKEKWLQNAESSKALISDQIKILDNAAIEEPLFKLKGQYVQQSLFESFDEIRHTTVNWDSPAQVLKLFKTIEPSLEGVGADNIYPLRKKHPIFEKYLEYKQLCKLYNSYGPKFLDNVFEDGKIHTEFRQILETGRVSSSKPNVQQIPQSNLYRNCFITGEKDYVFVSSDYSSQELCVIAYGSGDPVWLDALQKGQDLHSICAELIFGDQWTRYGQKDCKYRECKQKCDCKEHKKLRNYVKSINFGLAYGMTAIKLADKIEIPLEDAEQLIRKYFKTFPKIKKFLNMLGSFGTSNGYITTYPPFRRTRWFEDWSPSASFKTLGEIERRSKNTPIQGTSADMTKLALVLIREYIQKHKVPVKMVMTVHDQIDTIVKKDFAEEWQKQLTYLMEAAALKIIKNGLLKAETNTSEVWEK